MEYTEIMGMIGFGISVIGVIVAAVNHTRIRSSCCGKKTEISLDIERNSP
jgi:hypothetical protein